VIAGCSFGGSRASAPLRLNGVRLLAELAGRLLDADETVVVYKLGKIYLSHRNLSFAIARSATRSSMPV
jgi:hypothetical protein